MRFLRRACIVLRDDMVGRCVNEGRVRCYCRGTKVSSNRAQVGLPADGKGMKNGVQSDSHEPAAPVQRGKSVVREA